MQKIGLAVILASIWIFFSPQTQVYAYSTHMDASLVIGQSGFVTNLANQGGSAAANTLRKPKGLTIVGTKFVVADEGNNRVLIYNSLPTANNASADVVIGQADMSGTLANRGGSAAANTLDQPYAVTTDGTRLLISDMGNDRVLIYNTVPTVNGANADAVIGQTDMTGSSYDTSQIRLSGPMGIRYDSGSGKLVVTDNANNRVLIYNSIPTTNGAAADVVVGQADFDSSDIGTTGLTQFLPYDAGIFNNKLFISDTSNYRVLIYNSVPTTSGASADVVIGQTSLTGSDYGPSATSTDQPTAVYYDGSHLFVSDWDSRVLIYDSIPSGHGASADLVLGQTTFDSDTANAGGLNKNTLNGNTLGIVHAGNYLYVSDTENNRVLRYTNDDPGFLVTDKPAGVSMVLSADETSAVDSIAVSGRQTVRILSGSTPVSDVVIDFSENRDWGSVTANSDTSANKAVISITGADTGATGTHSLYIPRGDKNLVRICPNATTLSDVNTSCFGGVNFSGPFPQTQTVGSGSVTVNTVTISGTDYFVATGLTGSGGLAYQNEENSGNISNSVSGSGSNSPGSAPVCGQSQPIGIPDLFQIKTSKNGARIYFSPVLNNTRDYVIAFGFTPRDLRYGMTVPAYDWSGVQTAEISELTKNTTYYIQVRAGNGCATGYWSEPMKFRTDKQTYHKYNR
jgi:hypothetical protein